MKTINFQRTRSRIFSSLILFCTTCLAATPTASAAAITVPAGLSPGSQYRLAFVTSTKRDAASSNIGDYNLFVTTAANSVPELAALATSWTAIASTASTAANDNTNTNPSVLTGHPIYGLAGHLIATNNADLWDGTILHALNVTETGVALDFAAVWTGPTSAGLSAAAFSLGNSTIAYGLAQQVTFWNSGGAWSPSSSAGQFYGMSDVLTAPVPEPGVLLLTCIAVAGLAVSSRRLRRNSKASTHVVGGRC
jgi:hypothetical protein